MHSYWWMHPEDPWGLMIESFLAGEIGPSTYDEVFALVTVAALVDKGNLIASPAMTLGAISTMLENGPLTLSKTMSLNAVADHVCMANRILTEALSLGAEASVTHDKLLVISALLSLAAVGTMAQDFSMEPILKVLKLGASASASTEVIGSFIASLRLDSSASVNLVPAIVLIANLLLQGSAEIATLGGFILDVDLTLSAEARMRAIVSIAMRLLKNLSLDSVSGRKRHDSVTIDEVISEIGRTSITKKGEMEIDPSPGKKGFKPN